ncbi:MAG: nucleotidyltransferase, partial [bacterium]|nr:nucleotidyltransferase [bacterium]
PALFGALEESIDRGDASLSGGMKVLAAAGKAKVMDIGDKFWLDVDNEEMLKRAEKIITDRT